MERSVQLFSTFVIFGGGVVGLNYGAYSCLKSKESLAMLPLHALGGGVAGMAYGIFLLGFVAFSPVTVPALALYYNSFDNTPANAITEIKQ